MEHLTVVANYTTQVSTSGTPGTAGAYTQIIVNAATADSLYYYYCSNHSGMGGNGVVSVQGLSLADSGHRRFIRRQF